MTQMSADARWVGSRGGGGRGRADGECVAILMGRVDWGRFGGGGGRTADDADGRRWLEGLKRGKAAEWGIRAAVEMRGESDAAQCCYRFRSSP